MIWMMTIKDAAGETWEINIHHITSIRRFTARVAHLTLSSGQTIVIPADEVNQIVQEMHYAKMAQR